MRCDWLETIRVNPSWTLATNTPDFTRLSPNANDKMVSCKIQQTRSEASR
jgi:hypothetical protein